MRRLLLILAGMTALGTALAQDPEPAGPVRLWVPQVSGMEISRTLNLAKGTSLPHWNYQPLLTLKNPMPDRANEGGILSLDTWSHNENQTFDFMLWRHNYSQGDNYLIDAKLEYMGDGHSTTGNANSALYAAITESDTALFRGVVEAWDPATGELTYQPGARADTLGSGRPLINLNPAKWIVVTNAYTFHPGGAILGWGGTTRAANAAWTPDVVGRYFALDEPDEYVPGGDTVRRWFLITACSTDSNGVRRLSFQRHWWGAKDGQGLGRLYHSNLYTPDESAPRFLRAIIAPGINVYDVSEGVQSPHVNSNGCPRRIRLAPSPFAGTAVDFAPGDPVEQAVGPDPFKPVSFRSWLWDAVPGLFPAPIFDIANQGVSRHAVLTVEGGSGSLAADRTNRIDHAPPWNMMLNFSAASKIGLVFGGDTAHAALLFAQPNLADGFPQTIRWNGLLPRTLGVNTAGALTVSGVMPLNLAGGTITGTAGLSATPTPARNRRGLRIGVEPGAARLSVVFPEQEHDAAYAVRVRPSWLAETAVTQQTEKGFTVEFDRPAGPGGAVDWALVR